MKAAFFVFLIFSSFSVIAQQESYYDARVEEDFESQEEIEENEENTDEDQTKAKVPEDKLKKTIETDKQVIRVECVCPENDVQEQEAETAVNSLFPEDSVFIISPDNSTAVPEQDQKQEEEIKRKDVIPGYQEKVPRGYSDETYKEVPWQ